MLMVGLFAAAVLAYALVSRALERLSISPQIVVLGVGLLAGVALTEMPEVHLTSSASSPTRRGSMSAPSRVQPTCPPGCCSSGCH
jgi:hypothetical protein